ncbi:MAG: beta-mannosidase [Bacteroidota bacterium]
MKSVIQRTLTDLQHIRMGAIPIFFMLAAISGMSGSIMAKNSSVKIVKQIDTQWKFRDATSQRWYSASVPGNVHTDLLSHKLIPDPFYRTNEEDLQWIGERDWVYQTHFDASSEFLKRENVALIFKGLDTYAKVYLNDSLILSTDNMFREWTVDARPLLRHGQNKITIFFRNVFDETLPKYRNAPFELQAFPNNDQGDPRIAMYSRKAQFHFGWDWGPRLVTCGIWKPIILEAWDSFRIDGVHIMQENVTKESADILSVVNITSTKDQTVTIAVNADSRKLHSERHQLTQGANTITIRGAIKKPKLWWSNGLGEQYLYQYSALVTSQEGKSDEYRSTMGVRSLKVVREKDSSGIGLRVELNGVPVFMKGANYIPLDNFQNRVTPARHEQTVKAAADVNMNMLRVWGGGIYEDDSFYDMCDKYGILIWHDMLFACAMYPGDKNFLNSVRHEVVDNITRIRNHPSIALYCGNNENEVAWEQWGWKQKYSPEHQATYERDLKALYYETIPSALREADSSRYYHPSSPMAGFADRPKENGDTHYWGVWHGKDPFEKYEENVSRFVSEYGFQSYPELGTIKKYTLRNDRVLDSKVMLAHQRCMADERKDKQYGNRLIKTYMDRYFREPKDFTSYLYVSQLVQSLGVQMAVEAHRRAMPFCMGSLYWQIDDCWPVASWSSIDYYGKWKALHYQAKEFFAPIFIAPKITGDSVQMFIVSDTLAEVEGTLQVSVTDLSGNVVFDAKQKITVLPNSSRNYGTFVKDSLLGGRKMDRHMLVSRFVPRRGTAVENRTYFVYPKELALERPNYSVSVKKKRDGVEITLSADKLAKNVMLQFPEGVEGHFSENYFDLLPKQQKKIFFRTDSNRKDLVNGLKVLSLIDTY